MFDRLGRGDMDGIVEIQLKRLREAAAGAQDHARPRRLARKAWLADEGYDPVFGARPLKRVIQSALQDQLAEMILAGEVLDEDRAGDRRARTASWSAPASRAPAARRRAPRPRWCTEPRSPARPRAGGIPSGAPGGLR